MEWLKAGPDYGNVETYLQGAAAMQPAKAGLRAVLKIKTERRDTNIVSDARCDAFAATE